MADEIESFVGEKPEGAKEQSKTLSEKALAEKRDFRKLIKKDPWLALVVFGIVSVVVLFSIGPKAWRVVEVMANPRLAELSVSNSNLLAQVEALKSVNNSLTTDNAQRTRERDEATTQLRQRARELDETRTKLVNVSNLAFNVRVDAYNGGTATKRMTVANLINGDSIEIFPDMVKLPGFDDNEGIARRLTIIP